MISILISDNKNSREEFDKVFRIVKELKKTIQNWSDTEILLFIPEGSYEFKETYTRVIRLLMTDLQNTNWNKVSFDSYLFSAMLVMMDGIFWKDRSTLEYNPESFKIDWLKIGLFDLNPYIRVND